MEIPMGSRKERRVLDYMDHLNVLCRDKLLMERALQHAQTYRAPTGAKLNVAKSTFLALGKLRILSTLGVSVPPEGVKILRVV